MNIKMDLTADQKEIYEFLRLYKQSFVSANEISKRLGTHRRWDRDKTWARSILRRMEMEGYVESNPFGEYKIRDREEDTSFRKALTTPGMDLGDTTIIHIDDAEPIKGLDYNP